MTSESQTPEYAETPTAEGLRRDSLNRIHDIASLRIREWEKKEMINALLEAKARVEGQLMIDISDRVDERGKSKYSNETSRKAAFEEEKQTYNATAVVKGSAMTYTQIKEVLGDMSRELTLIQSELEVARNVLKLNLEFLPHLLPTPEHLAPA